MKGENNNKIRKLSLKEFNDHYHQGNVHQVETFTLTDSEIVHLSQIENKTIVLDCEISPPMEFSGDGDRTDQSVIHLGFRLDLLHDLKNTLLELLK